MIDLSWAIDPIYIATIFFFIVGMQRMSHPLTARSGIVWAGAAMLIATLITFFTPNLTNFALIAIAIVIGGGFGYIAAKRVGMTNMPPVSYTHLRAHETDSYLVCRLLLEKKKQNNNITQIKT